MSKHDQDITWRVSCSSIEQRERLKIKAKEVAGIMQLENAEMLEVLLDRALPDFSIPTDRSPMERRMGADFNQDDYWKQSGTSQQQPKRVDTGVTPPNA